MRAGDDFGEQASDDIPTLHIWGLTMDSQNLLIATCIGFFLFTLIRIVGIVCGDKSPITVCGKIWIFPNPFIPIKFFQDIVFALCGFFLFIGSGFSMIDSFGDLPLKTDDMPVSTALAAMAIITSLVYLADLAFGVMKLVKDSNESN